MSPYFADHAVTEILFGVTVAVWVVVELRKSIHTRVAAASRDAGSHAVLVVCVAAGWVVTAIATNRVTGARIADEPIGFVVGLAVAWAGICLRWSAFHALGQYFTFQVQTSPDQPVIDTGPYRYVRHPSYTGIELILLGLAALYGTWIGIVAMLVLPTVGLVNRIRVEERALFCDLGEPYRAYAASRKRLIPYIW